MTDSLALRSRHIVTRDGVVDGVVMVREGVIADVVGADRAAAIDGLKDLGRSWLIPGLVDSHVHVNEPGRTEWEGFDSATRAAAAGGVTTLVDMPLNCVPATTTADAMHAKRAIAEGRCHVNVGFWGGVVPGNAAELEGLARAGALGFKCFLVPSGVDEFPHVTEADLDLAIPAVSRLALPFLSHAEVPGPIEQAMRRLDGADPRRYATWLASRPPAAESKAVRMIARRHFVRPEYQPHIVHLSSVATLLEVDLARGNGHAFTIETCPHYLCFDAEQIPDGATEYKCAPPIRERSNRDHLWEALLADRIHMIASDHSPCPPEMKGLERGDFMTAWGGIASLEIGLSAVWTEARRRGIPLPRVVQWMSRNPAMLAGQVRKGTIAAGYDADLVVFDPDREWTVEPERLRQRHKVTPYAGQRLLGVVEETYVRGRCVFDRGQFPSAPFGTIVLRGGYENRFGPPPRDLVRQSLGLDRPR